jgi:hypothetical protein
VILIFNNLNIYGRDFNLIQITILKKKISLKNDFYEILWSKQICNKIIKYLRLVLRQAIQTNFLFEVFIK